MTSFFFYFSLGSVFFLVIQEVIHMTSVYFLLLGVPLISSLIIFFIPAYKKHMIQTVALWGSGIVLVGSMYLYIFYNQSSPKFQFTSEFPLWFPWQSSSSLSILFGVDGISLFFIILTALLIFLCILSSLDSITYRLKDYMIAFLVLESLLMGVFSVLDLLCFYILFEGTLIPMFIMILTWGSRERKIRAAAMLFLYTLVGSVFLLLSILYLYKLFSCGDYYSLHQYLSSDVLTISEKRILWLAFFVSFATKVPMIPFHLWLPEAHVEAPTAGSVILAGILLKLGTYGFIRYCIGLLPEASKYFSPAVFALAMIGVMYTSLTAIRQTDFKRIIAYTSIAHMNLAVGAIFTLNMTGLKGAMLLSIGHGFVSGALFLIIGVVYDRFHTRLVKYYSGLALIMPLYAVIFVFFTMANIGLPGTSNFIGEFLILCGLYLESTWVCVLGATGMVLGGAYSLWLLNRIVFGNLKRIGYDRSYDITYREFLVFFPLVAGTLLMGVYPVVFSDALDCSIVFLVDSMNLVLSCS
jgi:NADH-quinone oxidoreductase subunit M